MHNQIYRIAVAALTSVTLLASGAALAAETVTMNGPDGQVAVLDAASLSALPVTEVAASYRSSKGIETGIYKGVLLWDLLQARGLVGQDHKPALRHTLLATAGDGHQIAFSVGEIAPDFGNTPVMLAYEMNGAPIPDGLRMVVPGDLRGARHIKDIVTLDYR